MYNNKSVAAIIRSVFFLTYVDRLGMLFQQTLVPADTPQCLHYVFQQLETEKIEMFACKKGINRLFEQRSEMEYKTFSFFVSRSLKTLSFIQTDKIVFSCYILMSVILFKSKNLTLNIS